MQIFEELDILLDECPNPKMILLGTEEFARLDKALHNLGLGARFLVEQLDKFSGVTVVKVEGRSNLMQAIPGDSECTVTAHISDFRKILVLPIPHRLKEAIREAIDEATH